MLLSEAVRRFTRRYSNPRTAENYRWLLEKFIEAVGDQPIDAVTPEIVEDWYYDDLLQRNLSPVTVANRTIKLKAFWNWCAGRFGLPVSPAAVLISTRPNPEGADKAIPYPILMRMLAAVGEKRIQFFAVRDTALLSFLMQYGARRGDAASLCLSRMDETKFTMTVKGGRTASFPWTVAVRPSIDDWLAIRRTLDPDPYHDYLWVNNRKAPGARYQPLEPSGIALMVRKLSKLVGENYGPHAIRHWRGQSLADSKVPPTITRDILCHRNVTTTLNYYYNQGDDRVQAALEAYSGLEYPDPMAI